jgi:WD40 repeat protein
MPGKGQPVLALEALTRCRDAPSRLLSSASDGGIHVYQVAAPGECVPTTFVSTSVPVVALAHNENFVISGLYDGKVQLLHQVPLTLTSALPSLCTLHCFTAIGSLGLKGFTTPCTGRGLRGMEATRSWHLQGQFCCPGKWSNAHKDSAS